MSAFAQHPLGLFVGGTDTGVGKTHVACLLIQALRDQRRRIYARKPIESGCRREGDTLMPADAVALREAAGNAEPLPVVCPYPLVHGLAPNRAARLQGQNLQLRDLVLACTAPDDGIVVVEGAGGLLSPLTDDGLNADLATALGFPVLVVAADRLGCINHVLLTAEAIQSRGLTLAAVLLNPLPGPARPEGMDNLADLRSFLGDKVIGLEGSSEGARAQLDRLATAWFSR